MLLGAGPRALVLIPASGDHFTFKGGAAPFVVAAAVGLVLGTIEQADRLEARFTLANYAWAWWLGRVVVEAFIGLMAMVILREADRQIANHLWAWFVAGAAGPAVVRLRVLDLEARPVGLATIYEPAREFIEKGLTSRSAECTTSWFERELLPGLLRVVPDPGALVDYASTFLGLKLPAKEASTELKLLQTWRDGAQSSRAKVELIARHIAVELHEYRMLERYLAEHDENVSQPKPWFRRIFTS